MSIEEKQAEVRRNFEELDHRVHEIEDPARRVEIMRDIADLKAETAPLIREDRQMRSYGPETAHADYRGLVVEAGDRQAELIKEAADRAVARLAERFGMRPEAAVARHADEVVSPGLSRDYRAQERAERAADRAARAPRLWRKPMPASRISTVRRARSIGKPPSGCARSSGCAKPSGQARR